MILVGFRALTFFPFGLPFSFGPLFFGLFFSFAPFFPFKALCSIAFFVGFTMNLARGSLCCTEIPAMQRPAMDCVPDTPCLGAVTRYFPLGLVGLGVKTIRSAGSVGFEKDKILLAVLMDGGARSGLK